MTTDNTEIKTIMMADDDMDDREFFEAAVQDIQLATAVTFAIDGAELMADLHDNVTTPPPPHILFLDLNMPRKSGIECLKEIKETPKLKDIPVVIFSTTANKDAIEKTYALGADRYVCKPTSHKGLVKAIEDVLALKLWENNPRIPIENYMVTA